jgi:hypothetical protein
MSERRSVTQAMETKAANAPMLGIQEFEAAIRAVGAERYHD